MTIFSSISIVSDNVWYPKKNAGHCIELRNTSYAPGLQMLFQSLGTCPRTPSWTVITQVLVLGGGGGNQRASLCMLQWKSGCVWQLWEHEYCITEPLNWPLCSTCSCYLGKAIIWSQRTVQTMKEAKHLFLSQFCPRDCNGIKSLSHDQNFFFLRKLV